MIAAWWSWMSAMTVQIVVVVAVVALLERLLVRKHHPRLASALWLVALAKLATPPTLESPVSLAQLAPGFDAISMPSFAAVALWIWVAGVVLFGSLAVRRHLALRRDLLSRSLGASRVREVGGLGVPCVLGFWRPIVLVPAGGADPHALLHELTHIKRRDPLMGLVALAIQILYWFHPAAWIIRSRLATLREIACDADAARSLGDRAPEYRRMLADVARRLLTSPAGVTALAFGRSGLVERLEWLSKRPAARRWPAVVIATLALAACVPLARAIPPPFAWPTLDQTQGCMQRRLVVMEALSRNP